MQGPFAYVCQMFHPSDGDIHCSGALWRVCTAAELFWKMHLKVFCSVSLDSEPDCIAEEMTYSSHKIWGN